MFTLGTRAHSWPEPLISVQQSNKTCPKILHTAQPGLCHSCPPATLSDFGSLGVRDKLDTHKSIGPNEMHPRVLKELAKVIAKALSVGFERSWRTGEVPATHCRTFSCESCLNVYTERHRDRHMQTHRHN